ncbi:MAG: TetR/AcrR family transcriptional regulator [Candidatus Rokubacteria bacterium]|nr:TetR/AcrR family transcriptional regulator [Candidatus Rokubacteria bacterium]
MARRKEFDQEQALTTAMKTFWSKGYEATSVQDLVDRMGVQRGSLYGSFKDKQSLFLAAIDRYDRVVVKEMLDILDEPGPGKEAIRRFFETKVKNDLRVGHPGGCFVTNSAVERALSDAATAKMVRNVLGRLEAAFYRALVRAREAGEIDGDRDLRALARYLTNSTQGLSVMTKVCADRSVLTDIVNITLSVLQ